MNAPMEARPRLAVIIVSYNTRELLRACLTSVEAAAAYGADRLTVTIHVADNASRDGSAAMVASEFPGVRLIALDENIGFTGGNNLVLTELGFAVHSHVEQDAHGVEPPDYVLLLNPDTEAEPNSLLRLVSFMMSESEAGACGPQLRYGNGDFQHGAFIFPGLAQIFLDIFPVTGIPGMHRLRESRINGRYPRALWDGDAPFFVDFVLGAALCLRGTTIAQIGGLDEGYFMYCEEMDWCLRAQETGWSVYAVPDARVIHHEGQSSKQTPWPSFVRLWRSRLRFYGKFIDRYPLWYLWLVRGVLRTGLALRSRAARQAFAQGRLTGQAADDELTAYQTVKNL